MAPPYKKPLISPFGQYIFMKGSAMNKQEELALKGNQTEIYMFSFDDLLKEASEKLGKSLEDFDSGTVKTVAGFYSPATDVMLVVKILKELGVTGKVATKKITGKSYII
jgi:hypothetical protein